MKNCEFYKSHEERSKAFRKYCSKADNGTGVGHRKCNEGHCVECSMEWLDAEAKDIYKVYDGTKTRIFGWSLPIVIDLKGCRVLNDNQCDLLTTTEEDGSAENLGRCKVAIRSDGIYALTNRTKTNGYSVGVEVEAAERIDTGSREINGQTIEAPFYNCTSSVLKEIFEIPDDTNALKVSLSTKSDEVIDLEKRVADLERENAELMKKNANTLNISTAIRDVKYENDIITFTRVCDGKKLRFDKNLLQIYYANPFEGAGLGCLQLTEQDACSFFGSDWKTRDDSLVERICRENEELKKEKGVLLDELSKLVDAALTVINPFQKVEHLRDCASKASLEVNLRRVGFVQKP